MIIPSHLAATLLAIVSIDAIGSSATQESNDTPAQASWPTIAIGYQDAAPSGDWAPIHAWFVSGYAVGAKKGTSVDEFIAASTESLQEAFATYIARHPSLTPETTSIVVLDIESPEPLSRIARLLQPESPELSKRRFNAVIESFKRRVAVAKQALPKATICLYGFGSPSARGNASPEWKSEVAAQRVAVELGLLELIDGVCPVLYSRFGPADSGFKTSTLATENSIAACREIMQGVERAPKILPLLSFAVFNGNSPANGQSASIEGTARRLEVLSKLGIQQVVFWSAKANLPDEGEPTQVWFTSLMQRRPGR